MLPRSPEPQHLTDQELEILAAVLPTIVSAGSFAAGMAVRILSDTNREIQARVAESSKPDKRTGVR